MVTAVAAMTRSNNPQFLFCINFSFPARERCEAKGIERLGGLGLRVHPHVAEILHRQFWLETPLRLTKNGCHCPAKACSRQWEVPTSRYCGVQGTLALKRLSTKPDQICPRLPVSEGREAGI